MSQISAALVMKLRKISGQGMMDCKKALIETNGDLDEAMAVLRKKGLATLKKRAARETTEGKVVCKKSDDEKKAAIATLCCETDFVSKSDDFVAAAKLLAECSLLSQDSEGPQAILETEIQGKKFSEILTEAISKTGEKMEVGDFTRYEVNGTGLIGTYVHFNDKLGTMVEIETTGDEVSCALTQTATDIAMHITAINPVAIDADSIGPDTIEKEKAIAAEQVKNKPANIIDKIVEGKLNKFFKENCLLNQPFVKDDSTTVGCALEEAAKQAGGEAKIKRFIRMQIG